VVHSLDKRHLIYISVPVSGHQHFSTSSLEGFVSNKDMVAGDADPMESLLYEVFVSNSERLSVDALAQVLGRPPVQIQQAISAACRLGFAQLITSDGVPPAYLQAARMAVQPRRCSPGVAAASLALQESNICSLHCDRVGPDVQQHTCSILWSALQTWHPYHL
jgi:hypothetical protein